jgi:hypothetical protein
MHPEREREAGRGKGGREEGRRERDGRDSGLLQTLNL